MDFLDNVMKSSNALLKDRLNNPFGTKQDQTSSDQTPDSANSSENAIRDQEQDKPLSQQASTTSNSSSTDQAATDPAANDKTNSQFAAIAADAEAVTQKAVKGAKNIGSFLFSMAKEAGQTVSQTAKQVKQAVESTSILTDFTREQQEFIREHGGSMQAGELPWTGCSDETKAADIREQVLSLSQDRRNFVRSPPNDSSFQFDSQQCYPIALSLLKEDPNLSKMRFELVPKMVSEDSFWRNYFYRVSLLKQMSDRGEDVKRQGWTSSRSSSGEGPDEVTFSDGNQVDDITSQAITKNPGQSSSNLDSTVAQELESSRSRELVAEADDLKSKLKELNIGSLDDGSGQDDADKWEEELQRDLQEFELVSGDVSALDEETLDEEIKEMRMSANKTKVNK